MLTVKACQTAKSKDKAYKLADGNGLSLHVAPNGSKYWRFKFRHLGKEKLLALGTFPEVPLVAARMKRDEARKLLADGVDPSAERRQKKIEARLSAGETFAILADDWLKTKCANMAETTLKKKRQILKNNLLPWLGTRPVREIAAPELLAVLRRVESRGAHELAHRTLQLAGQVLRFALVTGRIERNPAADLRGALSPVVVEHHAAVTDPKELGALLRAINGFSGTFVVRCALRLAPLVFVRPGELRAARWRDISLETATWSFTMPKVKLPHIVPLSEQAVAILQELQQLTGDGEYVFPSLRTRDRPMSDNTINGALRRIGYQGDEMVAHGWRAVARTLLDEVLGWRVDLIEHQLGHEVIDANGRAYNRTSHLPERKKMMQAWSDYLDKLREGAEVIPLSRQA